LSNNCIYNNDIAKRLVTGKRGPLKKRAIDLDILILTVETDAEKPAWYFEKT